MDEDLSEVYLLNRILRKCGVQNVASVTTADDASKYLVGLHPFEHRSLPNLIFVDLKMAGLSGLHLISSLKGNLLFSGILLIALSGSNDPIDQQEAIMLGANACYEKTHSQDNLKAMVDDVLTLDEPLKGLVLQT